MGYMKQLLKRLRYALAMLPCDWSDECGNTATVYRANYLDNNDLALCQSCDNGEREF